MGKDQPQTLSEMVVSWTSLTAWSNWWYGTVSETEKITEALKIAAKQEQTTLPPVLEEAKEVLSDMKSVLEDISLKFSTKTPLKPSELATSADALVEEEVVVPAQKLAEVSETTAEVAENLKAEAKQQAADRKPKTAKALQKLSAQFGKLSKGIKDFVRGLRMTGRERWSKEAESTKIYNFSDPKDHAKKSQAARKAFLNSETISKAEKIGRSMAKVFRGKAGLVKALQNKLGKSKGGQALE